MANRQQLCVNISKYTKTKLCHLVLNSSLDDNAWPAYYVFQIGTILLKIQMKHGMFFGGYGQTKYSIFRILNRKFKTIYFLVRFYIYFDKLKPKIFSTKARNHDKMIMVAHDSVAKPYFEKFCPFAK